MTTVVGYPEVDCQGLQNPVSRVTMVSDVSDDPPMMILLVYTDSRIFRRTVFKLEHPPKNRVSNKNA